MDKIIKNYVKTENTNLYRRFGIMLKRAFFYKNFLLISLLISSLVTGCGGGGISGIPDTGTDNPAPTSIPATPTPGSTPSIPANISSFLDGNFDWILQDYSDSQAIKKAELTPENHLKLLMNLKGGDINLSKGEIYIDLRYCIGLEGQTPLDLNGRKLSVTLEIPPALTGDPDRPNGVQLWCKNTEYNYFHGAWQNILTPGPMTVEWNINQSNIIIIGLKVATGDGSLSEYSGELEVTDFSISSPLTGSPLPDLPEDPSEPVSGFLTGGNWRLIDYGQNFGTTAWYPAGYGVSKHPVYIAQKLRCFKAAGIDIIRVELCCDGRTLMDASGNVTGYNEIFRDDLRKLLEIAGEAGVKIEFTLVDFLIAGRGEDVNGVWIRGRANLFTDETVKENFYSGFLIPFLQEFSGYPSFYSIDIINEPEWIISKTENGAWEDTTANDWSAENPIPFDKLRSFVNDTIGVIKTYAPAVKCTTGVSITHNRLTESLNVDYYSYHFYPYMGDLNTLLDNLDNDNYIIEEYPTDNISQIDTYLSTIYSKGGKGAYCWNLSPEIDEASCRFADYTSMLETIRLWIEGH